MHFRASVATALKSYSSTRKKNGLSEGDVEHKDRCLKVGSVNAPHRISFFSLFSFPKPDRIQNNLTARTQISRAENDAISLYHCSQIRIRRAQHLIQDLAPDIPR